MENIFFYIYGRLRGTSLDSKELISLLYEYILYIYISIKYKEDLNQIKEETSDPIKIELAKQDLRYKLRDDLLVYSLDKTKPEDELVQDYCVKMVNITSLNPDLKEYLHFDFHKRNKNIIYSIIMAIDLNKFNNKKDLLNLLDSIQYYYYSKSTFGSFYGPYIDFIKKIGYNDSVKSVYDNAVGFGNFFEMDKDIDYLGIDINAEVVKFCKIKMIINGKDPNSIILGNTISCGIENKNKYDLVFSDMPFGFRIRPDDREILRYDERFSMFDFNITRGEFFFMADALYHTNDNGRCIVNCTQGFLFRQGAEREFRKYLIENNLIEGIINFPSGVYLGTSIPLSILIFNKNKKDDKIKLFDLTSFVDTQVRGRIKEMSPENMEKALDVYNKQIENDEKFAIISNSDVIEHDYDLSFSTYVEPNLTINFDFTSSKKKIEKLEEIKSKLEKSLFKNIKELEN